MLLILGWFVFSLLAGIIADTKGRSGIGVFFVSMIFSPVIGIIYAIGVPSKTKEQQNHASKEGAIADYRPCPFCAESIRRQAKKCKHCGSEIEAVKQASEYPCPNCGNKNSSSAATCQSCGRILKV